MVSKMESSSSGMSCADKCVLLPLVAEILKQLMIVGLETI